MAGGDTQYEPIGWEHDGIPLAGRLTRPSDAGTTTPLVIVFPGAAGGVERTRMTVEGLAARGYAVAAVSMYDARIDATDEAVAGTLYAAFHQTPELLRPRARGWFDACAALPGIDPARIATLGYCFGGMCVLEIARSGADVQATVSCHALLRTQAPAAPGAIRGEVQTWCGGRDPYVPQDDITAFAAEMDAAGVRHQLTCFSHAEHAFTDPHADSYNRPGIGFDPQAEAIAWAGTLVLLERCLRPGA